MAVIRDVMPAFELFQPASIDAALELLDRHGSSAWVLAGGLDSFDWLKDRIKRPSVVVDLSAIAELKGIRTRGDGLEIGAMTTLTEVVRHPVVRERYSILLKAAEAAASPQIRNQGTIGGNVSQDTRCWYYRAGWSCYRAGGNICYADTPTAINREHAILGADRCVAVNPSDTSPALIALEAEMVIRSRDGERVVAGRGLLHRSGHRHHAHDGAPHRRAADGHPAARNVGRRALLFREGRRSERVGLPARQRRVGSRDVGRHRSSACASPSTASRPTPLRLPAVENAVRGKRRDEATAVAAGDLAIAGAVPLHHNAYKVPLLRNLVKRAVRGTENTWTS